MTDPTKLTPAPGHDRACICLDCWTCRQGLRLTVIELRDHIYAALTDRLYSRLDEQTAMERANNIATGLAGHKIEEL